MNDYMNTHEEEPVGTELNTELNTELLNSCISVEEILLCIKELPSNKSPGIDSLECELFNKMH